MTIYIYLYLDLSALTEVTDTYSKVSVREGDRRKERRRKGEASQLETYRQTQDPGAEKQEETITKLKASSINTS